jgi:hypothetical protein
MVRTTLPQHVFNVVKVTDCVRNCNLTHRKTKQRDPAVLLRTLWVYCPVHFYLLLNTGNRHRHPYEERKRVYSSCIGFGLDIMSIPFFLQLYCTLLIGITRLH